MKIIATVVFVLISLCNNLACAQPSKRPFIVTQSMNYKGGVDLSSFNVLRNPIIYEQNLLPLRDKDDPIQGVALEKFAARLEKGPFPTVIDIERWSIYTTDENERSKNLKKLLNILEKLRLARPDLQFGYYGVVPDRVYWPLVNARRQDEKREWRRFNQRAFEDLVPQVDAIYPSLYTFYEDQSGWEVYAKQTLEAARALNKPVYCFLWPQYHDSNIKLQGQYLSKQYWRKELETCYRYSDGIVIWNHEPDKIWDAAAPWWAETLDFLKHVERNQLSK